MASESLLDASGTAMLSNAQALSQGKPIPECPALHKEKRILPRAPVGFSGISCITVLDASQRSSSSFQFW